MVNKSSDPRTTFERHHTPKDLGKLWGLSPRFIRELFRNEPGVLLIDRPEARYKRSYSTIRIPESVAVKVYAKLVANKYRAVAA